MISTFVTVFRHPRYTLTATLIAVSVFVLAVWLPNVRLIVSVVGSNVGTGFEKTAFLISLLGSIATNFTVMSAAATILIATLFGVNIALLIYYIKEKSGSTPNIGSLSGISMAGLISGFLGIGCAACGTFILTSILVLIGAAGALAYLPFGGEEFGLVGIALLFHSGFLLVKKIEQRTCDV